MIVPDVSKLRTIGDPFPHVTLQELLTQGVADLVLSWLREQAPWKLQVGHFYEQYEFSLLADDVPEMFRVLTADSFLGPLIAGLHSAFALSENLRIVDVSAHRLTCGQTIRIHNDHIHGEETHRLLIQINAGWDIECGGLLMLFGSEDPEDVSKVIIPRHGDGLAFEISPRSFHAVSQVRGENRYTLVYSFRV